MNTSHITALQRFVVVQLKRLASAGTATDEWWSVIGDTCVVEGQESLQDVESLLASQAIVLAERLLQNPPSDDDLLLGKIARFKQQCSTKVNTPADESQAVLPSTTLLDREAETKDIRKFLDDPNERVLYVSGLENVGKRSVVQLALSQAGRKASIWIELSNDTTLNMLTELICRKVGLFTSGSGKGESISQLSDRHILERIPIGAVIVLAHVENFYDHGQRRQIETPEALARFAESLSERQAKLILISVNRVELDLLQPRVSRRLWLRGLPTEYGALFLDQQLRRVGLDPTHFDISGRRQLVGDIGNHPGAVILAADYIEQAGFSSVADDLRKRTGVHTTLVRRIIRKLSFSHRQQELIGMLSECRVPVPSGVFNSLAGTEDMSLLNALLHQCVVERHEHDHLSLTDLIKGFADFLEVDSLKMTLFHKAAAEHFATLAGKLVTAEELQWAVESRFHAQLAGDINLAPNIPHLIDGVLGAVRALIDKHEYEKAKPIIDQLLASEQTAELYQLSAIVHARLGDCDVAFALAKEALARDSSRTWVVTEVGRLSLHVRRLDVASECVKLARSVGHDTPYLATLEGKIALRQSGEASAVEPFARAVRLADGEHGRRDAWPHFFLGRTLLKLGRADEAVDVLYDGELIASSQRRRKKRLLIAIRTQLAIAYVIDNRLEQAKHILDLIVSDEAGNPEVVWALALYRAASAEVTEAGVLAKETLQELNPKTAKDRYGRCQVYLFRALVYLGSGETERASEEFSLAHREDPRNVYVLIRWCSTLIDLAREADAEDEHQSARICAEQAKALADKICEFDKANEDALRILEQLSDEFNVT